MYRRSPIKISYSQQRPKNKNTNFKQYKSKVALVVAPRGRRNIKKRNRTQATIRSGNSSSYGKRILTSYIDKHDVGITN